MRVSGARYRRKFLLSIIHLSDPMHFVDCFTEPFLFLDRVLLLQDWLHLPWTTQAVWHQGYPLTDHGRALLHHVLDRCEGLLTPDLPLVQLHSLLVEMGRIIVLLIDRLDGHARDGHGLRRLRLTQIVVEQACIPLHMLLA